jgi:uncharacterized Zn-binding protein involved in type VI secretion
MGSPIAKKDDRVVAVDTHIVMIPGPNGATPTPVQLPFVGKLGRALCSTIFVDNGAAAVKGSGADNQPGHAPAGGPFQVPPSNRATVETGSATVFFDGKEVARAGDTAVTCNDPADAAHGIVRAQGSVFAG